MANHQSAKKRIRQTARRTEINGARRSRIRTYVRNVEEAIEVAREVGAVRTYLTHLTHRVTHAELEDRLPSGVTAAYDGLASEVD